jgi:hypothetical protein
MVPAGLVGTILLVAVGCENDHRNENDGSGASREFRATSLSYEEVLTQPEVLPSETPFEELLLRPADQSLVDYALWVIRQPCIDEEGFQEPARRRVVHEEDRATDGRRYYFIPIDQASVGGYSMPPIGATGLAQNDYEEAFDAYAASLGAAELHRFGDVVDHCLRQAEQQLCGGGDTTQGDGYCHRSLELASTRDAVSYEAASTSPAVRDAELRWSRCMVSAGYSFDSVEEAWDAGGRLHGELGIAQAVADMSCKDETGLTNVWSTVEAMVQLEMIERDPDFFDDLPDQRRAIIERATAVAQSVDRDLGAAGAGSRPQGSGWP